ncbi:uncharacterized protein AAGF69_012966 isoform 2-T3 [Amazona ochrocephala]
MCGAGPIRKADVAYYLGELKLHPEEGCEKLRWFCATLVECCVWTWRFLGGNDVACYLGELKLHPEEGCEKLRWFCAALGQCVETLEN